MALKRNSRRLKFGGDKRSGKRNQELRDLANKIHELEAQVEAERGLRRLSQAAERQVFMIPWKALEDICAMPVATALGLGLVQALTDVIRWRHRHYKNVASGNTEVVGRFVHDDSAKAMERG